MDSNKTSTHNFAIFVIILNQSKQFVSQTYFQKMTASNTPGFSFEFDDSLSACKPERER